MLKIERTAEFIRCFTEIVEDYASCKIYVKKDYSWPGGGHPSPEQ